MAVPRLDTKPIFIELMHAEEPTVRWKFQVRVLGDDPNSPTLGPLAAEVRKSPLVKQLLSEQQADGSLPHQAYSKWDGAHWVLANLADLDYPAGDARLNPLVEQEIAWLFPNGKPRERPVIAGKMRRCASQEGSALYSLLALGLDQTQVPELADGLVAWQWPDGGWNCDRHVKAKNASFMESLLPLRGLNLYARRSGDPAARQAVERAADIFLKRQLFRRQSDGSLIHPDFVRLHYPCYWHYDILFGLKVLAEAAYLSDPRCTSALDILEERVLPDGGIPVDAKYYRITDKRVSGRSLVDWSAYGRSGSRPVRGKPHADVFASLDALSVLRQAGRL